MLPHCRRPCATSSGNSDSVGVSATCCSFMRCNSCRRPIEFHRNGVGQDIHAASQGVVGADVVRGMREDRLPCRVRHLDCGVNNVNRHGHYFAMTHDGAGEDLDAIAAHRQRLFGQPGGVGRALRPRTGFSALREIFGDDKPEFHSSERSRRQWCRFSARRFRRSPHAVATPACPAGTEPMSKTVVSPHLVSMTCMCSSSLAAGARSCVVPGVFGEVHMAVPESSNDDPAGAFDDVGGLGYFQRPYRR